MSSDQTLPSVLSEPGTHHNKPQLPALQHQPSINDEEKILSEIDDKLFESYEDEPGFNSVQYVLDRFPGELSKYGNSSFVCSS